MINLVIDILKADANVTAITTADRIYPLSRLEGGTIPAIVVQQISTDPADTHDSTSTMDTNTVQVTIIEDKPKDANALAVLVRAALDGYGGNTIAEIRLTNQATDVFEAIDLFTLTQTYDVRVVRDNVTVPSALADLGELYLDDVYDVNATSPGAYSRLEYNSSNSTWAATTDLNIYGAVYSNPRILALTNGATFTVNSDDHLLFANYAATSGSLTAVLYLPAVSGNEGREIRLKTGSNLSHQRTLVLTKAQLDSGVTIDGSATATMDRDYDGITVHCIGGQWYITQRKSK
jgi:hypothetical protein